jgi:hypothetical protein
MKRIQATPEWKESRLHLENGPTKESRNTSASGQRARFCALDQNSTDHPSNARLQELQKPVHFWAEWELGL